MIERSVVISDAAHFVVPGKGAVNHIVDAEFQRSLRTIGLECITECGLQLAFDEKTFVRIHAHEFSATCIACMALAMRRGHDYR